MKSRGWRIYHYDIARGAYLTPEYVIKAIRLAAASGFTHFLPYLENMIRLPSIEKACPACAYTSEQWSDFETTARAAGITLVPHFNVIGHSQQACQAYPELAGRSGEKELDVSSATTRAWTVRCLEEFCAISQEKLFLIGGDEWQTPNHMLAKPGFSVARTWADQINLACDCLVSKRRTPLVWHDMLAHYPEALDLVSRDAVIVFWFYDEDSDYPFLDMLKERGFKTIMAAGTCSGLLTRRVQRGVECAMAAAECHAADGFMMTSWEDGRWEKLSATIPMVGAMLRGDAVPAAVLDAASALETLEKLPEESRFAQKCRDRLASSVSDKAWMPYPEFREYLTSVLANDPDRERASFLRYHHEAGPLLERIEAKLPARDAAASGEKQVGRGGAPIVCSGPATGIFRLAVEEKDGEGPILRFMNGGETFVVYPRFGGSLQDWRVGSTTVIPHWLQQFTEAGAAAPGGYRSYSGVGGFRPIWGLGTHSNPCILWQGPFEWRPVTESDDTIVVELSRRMRHVDVRYTITARRGLDGFVFRAEAMNNMEGAYGAFNFNLVLAVQPSDLDETTFAWTEQGQERRLRLSDQFDSFFRLPAVAEMTVVKPDYSVSIRCDPARTAGFYVDWATTFLTPDIRGLYRKMRVGEREVVEWRFAAKRRPREDMV
ncbi:MAG: family 20 glycosylhydrolase [Kiritimatiellae bacterium]|nr:family 20 glycosylhydrolase [Kiritimatiellia bacterium]